MFRLLSFIAALWALLFQICVASPILGANIERNSLAKRDTIVGPKIGGANFADPCILKVDFTWYAFATRTIGSSIHIQVATSTDFVNWNLVRNSDGSQWDALPNLPKWVYANSPNTWAPDVNRMDDGTFVMYYSASTSFSTQHHCLGAATSKNILGPYTSTSDNALICNIPAGGAIDPSGYNDNGQRYLLWKIDGNSDGKPTPIRITKVAKDGVTLQGQISTILNNEGAADGNIIEAPSLAKSASGTYFLFFSPGLFTTSRYSVSYATASNILGPYTRNPTPMIATGTDGLTSPGGADIDHDASHVVFHANSKSGRSMYTARLTLNGSTASIG